MKANFFTFFIGALLFISGTLLVIYVKRYYKEKEEKLKYQTNMYNAQFEIDSIGLKNNEYQYSINALTIDLEDLKELNTSLVNELEEQRLKIKNLSSVTKINATLKAKIDSLDVVKNKVDTIIINNIPTRVTQYSAHYNDEFLSIKEQITIPDNLPDNLTTDLTPIISDISLDIDSKLTISDERIYRPKKWWQFWKRKKLQNHRIHIKTGNPYLSIDKVETYNFE
jgi:hypothetical protein